MAELTTANSTYSAGPIDTYTPVSDGSTEILAQHVNGALSAIIAIEGDLGAGASLKRSRASLVERLDTILDVNGAIQNGTAFPTSPTPVMGQLFNRTDLKQLYIYDSALAQWQRIDSTNDHGALGGLGDDDHAIYALATGAREFTGNVDTTQNFRFKSGTAFQMALDHAATAARTITFPDATGSLVLSGSIVDADIGAGGLTNAAISASAAIADTKLATIATAGKVSESALPTALAYEDEANVFTANQRINAGLGVNIAPPATGDLAISGSMTSGAIPWTRLVKSGPFSGSESTLGGTLLISLGAVAVGDLVVV
ncbi:MAG: hypothetical protein ACE5F3_09105, partial [Mariprofundaceae bacterium]